MKRIQVGTDCDLNSALSEADSEFETDCDSGDDALSDADSEFEMDLWF